MILDLKIEEAYALHTFLAVAFEAMAEEKEEEEKAINAQTEEEEEELRREAIMWSQLIKIKQQLEIAMKKEVLEVVIPERNKMLGLVDPKGGNDETQD